jgi:hypothetical protein
MRVRRKDGRISRTVIFHGAFVFVCVASIIYFTATDKLDAGAAMGLLLGFVSSVGGIWLRGATTQPMQESPESRDSKGNADES